MPQHRQTYRPAGRDGRHLRVSRPSAVLAAAGFALLATWSAGSAWFILARDDIAQRVFARDTETTYAYQDRIKRLEDDLQREVTRNLVEKDGVSARIERMAARQAEIERQQQMLGRVANLGASSGTAEPSWDREPLVTGSTVTIPPANDDRPRPIILSPSSSTLRTIGGASNSGVSNGEDRAPTSEARPRDRLSLIGTSIDRISQAQFGLVGRLSAELDARVSGLRSAVAATGINIARLSEGSGMGGPLVPLPATASTTGGFGTLLASLEGRKAEYTALLGIARKLPLGRPLSELEQTSPFGTRYDPFTRAPAMHTGVDLRAETGTPARVTASGRVTVAEWSGGYGNMVEVDHGGGIVTRYGHLSAFLVTPGEQVVAGQAIGRVGSTGRSTGSHLHYETRIDGEPVDPNRFLQASRLASALTGSRF